MSNSATISFVATADLKALLVEWAKDEDRTVSATLRRILEAEARRRIAALAFIQEAKDDPHARGAK